LWKPIEYGGKEGWRWALVSLSCRVFAACFSKAGGLVEPAGVMQTILKRNCQTITTPEY
jgi:hypothetical protein